MLARMSTVEPDEALTAPEPDAASRLFDSDLGYDVGFLLARVSAWASLHGNLSLRPFDLNVRSYSILALSCSGTRPTQRECADFLSLDPSRVVSVIDELERRKLVRRVPSPSDRRTKLLEATPAGRELFEFAREATATADRIAFSHLSAEERRVLATALRSTALLID